MLYKFLLIPPHSTIRGFRLERATNGLIISYTNWRGSKAKMLVLDAKYRSLSQRFFTSTGNTNLNSQLYSAGYPINSTGTYITGSSFSVSKYIPDNITNRFIYSLLKNSTLVSDKTANFNTTSWINHASQYGGVPACNYVRGLTPSCNLPNEYQLIVIWALSDFIDKHDPTISQYPDHRLGYTNSTGRFYNKRAWSSTQAGRYDGYVSICGVNGTGLVSPFGTASGSNMVIPILEV